MEVVQVPKHAATPSTNDKVSKEHKSGRSGGGGGTSEAVAISMEVFKRGTMPLNVPSSKSMIGSQGL
jgi:hypothetical protein